MSSSLPSSKVLWTSYEAQDYLPLPIIVPTHGLMVQTELDNTYMVSQGGLPTVSDYDAALSAHLIALFFSLLKLLLLCKWTLFGFLFNFLFHLLRTCLISWFAPQSITRIYFFIFNFWVQLITLPISFCCQQSESSVHTHISPPFGVPFPFRSPQRTE